jgi:hypothetical protein
VTNKVGKFRETYGIEQGALESMQNWGRLSGDFEFFPSYAGKENRTYLRLSGVIP